MVATGQALEWRDEGVAPAIRALKIDNQKLPEEFWGVYNYVADRWYATEYGQVEDRDRWYHPAMLFLERFIAQRVAETYAPGCAL